MEEGISSYNGRSSFYEYFKRGFNYKQWDLETSLHQMKYLLINPRKVYSNFKSQKQTKQQWARDDPSFSILLILLIAVASDDSCSWKDNTTGFNYDLTPFHRDPSNPWVIRDGSDNGLFSMLYYVNFCGNHQQQCRSESAAVSEVLEVLKQPTDTCEILGKFEQVNYSVIDAQNPSQGIKIEYGGGDICSSYDDDQGNGQPRKASFLIYCDSNQDDNFALNYPDQSQGATKCTLEFKIKSPLGCQYTGGFASKLLKWLIIFFILYIVIGVAINYKMHNLSGKEAIPNIEFWRSLPMLIQDGAIFAVNKAKLVFRKVQARIKSGNSNYSEIV